MKHEPKEDYTNMQDKDIVQAVLKRFQLTQVELARIVFVTQPRISAALRGKTRLRPAIREQLVSMLEVDDTRG